MFSRSQKTCTYLVYQLEHLASLCKRSGNQQKYEPFFKYLYSDFKEGSMTLIDSAILASISFRYDITNDRMEMKSYIKPEDISNVNFGRRSFILNLVKIKAF